MGIGKGIAIGHVLTWNGSAWVSQAGSGGGGGADPNASYIVVGLTGSLPNERSLFATNGIIGADGGAGNPYGISIDDSVVATVSGTLFTGDISVPNLYSSGVITASLGLSGSLTKLTDSTSYLVAGTGISIASASNGQVTITNDGTVGDITSVTAGTGLTGGGTSGDITLDIDDSVVATVSGTTFTGDINSPNLYAATFVTGSTLFATTNITSSYAELGIGSIASTGEVRLPNNSAIVARNSTDTQDVSLISLDSNDDMHIGDGATNPDNMTLDVASTAVFRIAGGYKLAILSTYLDVVLPSIIFRDSASSPTLKQGDSSGATKGETLTVQAQTSTAGSSTGGNLLLAAGGGTTSSGDVQLSGNIISLTGSVETDGNNSITLDANAASRFLVDGANLILSASSADVVVNAMAGSTFGYSIWTNWGGHYHSSSQEININTPTLKMGGLTPLTTLQMTGSGGGALWSATGWHTASFGASRFELFGTDGVFLKGGAQSSAGLSDGFIVASGSSEVTTFLSNFAAGSQSIIGAINSAYSAGGGGTGADPNATYLVVSATGSLPNERSLFATNGIIGADGGAGNPYGISIDDSVVATVSGSTFTGAVNFNSGLSGSLTQLTDGTSYLKAGDNVTITSASNGAVTVNATAEHSPDETLYSFVRHLSGSGQPATASFAPYTFGASIYPLQPRTMLGIRYWNHISSPAAFTASLWESSGGSRVATGAHIAATGSGIQDIMFNTPYVFDDGEVGKEHRITILRGDTGDNPYATSISLIPTTPFIADVYLQDTFNRFSSGDAYPTSLAGSQFYILEPIWQKITQ